jgi:hypothetical protein
MNSGGCISVQPARQDQDGLLCGLALVGIIGAGLSFEQRAWLRAFLGS